MRGLLIGVSAVALLVGMLLFVLGAMEIAAVFADRIAGVHAETQAITALGFGVVSLALGALCGAAAEWLRRPRSSPPKR